VTLGLAERRVCRVLGQPRSTQRYQRESPADEAPLTAAMIKLASQYGRYGDRPITGLLWNAGWQVNRRRGERIWRREYNEERPKKALGRLPPAAYVGQLASRPATVAPGLQP
jgi:putative transposase